MTFARPLEPPRPPSTEPEVVFQARQISKLYRMGDVEVHALRAVDLELYRGEFVVILGPSGSGKSTLLNILGGLDVPTSGSVRFFDHDLTGASDRELTRFRREHVGFVFQFYNLIPRRVNIIADFADTVPALGDRYRVEARIVVWEGANVLKLPGSALFRTGDGWSVFVVEGGRARRRDVTVGHRSGFETEIVSGIAEGQVVIRDPTDRIADGVRVAVRKP